MTTNDSNPKSAIRVSRLSSADDIDQIWAIDSSATKKFGKIPALADLAATEESPEKFHTWLREGQVWTAGDATQAMGFLAAHEVDGVLYIDEISVHEDRQGAGIGAMLLKTVFEWAEDLAGENGSGVARVSLITYADVPWNGPWYKKHGFEEVDASVIGPWHVYKMTDDKEEQDLVRPGYRRCCMLREREVS